jgi:hypothetical protein
MIELTTSTTDSGLSINTFRYVVSRKGPLLDYLCFTPNNTSFIIGVIWFTTFFLFYTCFTVTSKNYSRRSNCLPKLLVGILLSLSKISFSQSSETSEHVSTQNSHKILPSFVTFLCQAMITTEGNYERKWRGFLNQWLLCCRFMILRKGCQMWSVCLQFETQISCIKISITVKWQVSQSSW